MSPRRFRRTDCFWEVVVDDDVERWHLGMMKRCVGVWDDMAGITGMRVDDPVSIVSRRGYYH